MRFRHAIIDPKLQNYVCHKYKKPLNVIYNNPYLIHSALGRKEIAEEKRLFQIINQIPNWGIGRLVTSTRIMMKYNEPSYWKITRVLADTSVQDLDYGVAWGVFTWRGRDEGIEQEITDANESRWRLIPKADEHIFTSYQPTSLPIKEMPLYITVPPLLSEILKHEKYKNDPKAKNKEVKVKLMVTRTKDNNLRQKLPDGTLV